MAATPTFANNLTGSSDIQNSRPSSIPAMRFGVNWHRFFFLMNVLSVALVLGARTAGLAQEGLAQSEGAALRPLRRQRINYPLRWPHLQRDRHEQSGRNQLRPDLQRVVHLGNRGNSYREGGHGSVFSRLVRSVHWQVNLQADHERGQERHGDLQRFADRERAESHYFHGAGESLAG